MKPPFPKYRLKTPNYGLKKGTVFIYLTCPNLYMMERIVTLPGGQEIKAGYSSYKFTPEQMDERYFEKF